MMSEQDPKQIIDQLAEDLGVKAEARKKWFQRGAVAHRWRLPILELAEKRGVKMDPAWFENARSAAA